MREASSTLILGVGNVLWADEGFGVRAVEHLHRHYHLPPGVTLMDGGTLGLYLLQHVQAADILVVFDAVDYGLQSGTLKIVEGSDVPRFLGAKKMSLHQTSFQEVLALAELLGQAPRQIVLIGVQPVELADYGGSLRPAVKAQIQPAIAVALTWLGERGICAQPRRRALPPSDSLGGAAIDIERYEQERPPAEVACRVGDARVLASPLFELGPRPHLIDNTLKVSVDQRSKR